MHYILSEITQGRGKEEHIGLLEELGDYITKTSLCALGGSAANPVLTTLRYFKGEYEAHIRDKKCPAGACKALFEFYIDETKCNGCTLCKKNCPQGVITGETKKPLVIAQEKCIKCGICFEVCRFGAVKKR